MREGLIGEKKGYTEIGRKGKMYFKNNHNYFGIRFDYRPPSFHFKPGTFPEIKKICAKIKKQDKKGV